ncbi:MAG: phosphatase [Actinomycetota bacterium]|nr:phosphatase [Actinomycetota bacterium]
MTIIDAEVAIAAAEAGADVVRARFDRPGNRTLKLGIDFVTETDLEAEEAILDVVRTAYPDDAFLGEEAGLLGDAAAERTWLVDPLCGTLNFAARTPLVGVNVALRVGAEVVAAAVAEPFADEVSWTDGTAAYLRRNGADTPLAPATTSSLVDVDLGGDPAWAAGLVVPLADAGFRTMAVSTSLAATWVASGRRAGYLIGGDMRDNVHFAAPVAVCRAAGCVVTTLDGRPLESGAPGLLVAADEETHQDLLAITGR